MFCCRASEKSGRPSTFCCSNMQKRKNLTNGKGKGVVPPSGRGFLCLGELQPQVEAAGEPCCVGEPSLEESDHAPHQHTGILHRQLPVAILINRLGDVPFDLVPVDGDVPKERQPLKAHEGKTNAVQGILGQTLCRVATGDTHHAGEAQFAWNNLHGDLFTLG